MSLFEKHGVKYTPGFSLTFPHRPGVWAIPGQLIIAAILFTGLSGGVWNAMRLGDIGISPIPIATAGLSYCFLSCGIPKKMWPLRLTGVAVVVIYVVTLSRYLIEGFNISLNHISFLSERWTGYIFPRYEVTGTGGSLSAGFFLALPAVFIGILSGCAVGGGRLWPVFIIVFTVFLWITALTGLYKPDVWCVVLAAGLAALRAWRHLRGNAQGGSGAVVPAVLCQTVILTALCILSILFYNTGLEDAAKALRSDTARLIHHLRYGCADAILPEGDFTNLKNFDPGDGTALMIRMEKPSGMYLRGYVGEAYTGTGWDALDTAHRGEYASLFSWLHDQNFFGQSQHSRLLGALGHGATGQTVGVLVMENCKARRFAPYEIIDADADPGRIGDEIIPAEGLWGEAEYCFQTAGRSVIDYDAIAAELSSGRQAGDKQIIAYLQLENAYREYIYDNYLAIPDQTEEAISDYLGRIELPADGRVSFRDAHMIVRAYLSEGFTYTDTPEAIAAEDDFAVAFLTGTREGYSVHYATAAALLFRYLGFPARYVEGWYISENEAGIAAPGEALVVDGTSALAWTEVYRDGIGFIPFEITPPDIEPEQQSDVDRGGSGGAEIPPEEPENEPLGLWEVVQPLLWGLLILLAAVILALIIRRQVKRRRLARILNDPDPAVAVSNITTWAVVLLEYMGITRQNRSLYAMESDVERCFGSGAGFRGMVETQQRALFSRTSLTESEVAGPLDFLTGVEAVLKHSGSRYERFRWRWFECVI